MSAESSDWCIKPELPNLVFPWENYDPRSREEVETFFNCPEIRAMKERICDIGRRLWTREYVDGNGGNISVRVAKNLLLCSPTLISKGFMKPEDIVRAREVVRDVYMDEKIERYIVDIVYATRTPADYGLGKLSGLISYGASPRASISLSMAAKAYAFIKRRGYVIPEDVRAVCNEVLRHRIGLTYEAEAENVTTENIISEIINAVEVP